MTLVDLIAALAIAIGTIAGHAIKVARAGLRAMLMELLHPAQALELSQP